MIEGTSEVAWTGYPRRSVEHFQMVIELVPCPYCGADIGKPCAAVTKAAPVNVRTHDAHQARDEFAERVAEARRIRKREQEGWHRMTQTVVVVFEVEGEDRALAQRVVDERLDSVRLLRENDSTDVDRGTLDPIRTYVVVPAAELLEEAL